MPNYCSKCWKELDCSKYGAGEYILSKDPGICECCRKEDYIVEEELPYPAAFDLFLFPYRYLFDFLCCLVELIKLPYKLYKHIKNNRRL